jgi:hypothetical protein
MCTPLPSWAATTAPVTWTTVSSGASSEQRNLYILCCLTLSGWCVGALYHRPDFVDLELAWALLHRLGNIVLADVLLLSSGIIGLAHLPLH